MTFWRAGRPTQVWLFIFALWGLFLSGSLKQFVGTPGVLQALRLNGLLESKQERLAALEENVRKLEDDAVQLEKNRLVQEREIRLVLGYAREDEIIFDFSAAEQPVLARAGGKDAAKRDSIRQSAAAPTRTLAAPQPPSVL